MAAPVIDLTSDQTPASRAESFRASPHRRGRLRGGCSAPPSSSTWSWPCSLAPINAVGKNSPIQVAAYRNDYLRDVIRTLGLDRASLLQLRVAAFIVIVLLILVYCWAIYIFRNREDKRLGSILLVTVGLSLILVLLPPLFSRDVFSNIYYGKIKAVYGANPYTSSPQKFMSDSILPFTSTYWKNTPSSTGPSTRSSPWGWSRWRASE